MVLLLLLPSQENNATFGTIQNLYLDAPTVMTFQGNANLDGLKSIVATEGATRTATRLMTLSRLLVT